MGKFVVAPPIIERTLDLADIQIDGDRPHDITLNDPSAFFNSVLTDWSLGFGESYVRGDWDCQELDECICRLLKVNVTDALEGAARLKMIATMIKNKIVNRQTQKKAFEVAEKHYNIGNDLFEAMLDSRMIYSCGYWERAGTLEQAQLDKLDMICQKLDLCPGEKLLDVGCGWGGLARHAAQNYGVTVIGLTVSAKQKLFAETICKGLPVEVRLQDYRLISEPFDKIVSVGMFEHVGLKNYQTYFDSVSRSLNPGGLFLLHTIGNDVTTHVTDPWIDKYVFPNGKIPSANQITSSLENTWLIQDWHNFGEDYDRTLKAWHHNFIQAWPTLEATYGEQFFRFWSYYLLSCAGYFRSGQGQLWQIVLSKRGYAQNYRSRRFSVLR